MTLSELGERMSNYELNITWPAYFVALAEEQEIRRKFEGASTPEQFDADLQRGRQ